MNKTIAVEKLEIIIELCRLNDEIQDFKRELTPSVQQIAVQNGVAAWIYSRGKNGLISGIDSNQLKLWKSVYFQNTIQFQKYLSVFKKVNDQLQKHGIPLLALKGIALASQLYTDEGLRPMGDIDILVPEGKGLEALGILLRNGAQQLAVPRSVVHEQTDAHVRAISVDGIMVEIHQRLFSKGSVFYLKDTDRFQHCVRICKQGVVMYRMNDVLMAYHLVAHVIKGIRMGGLRLGWLLDIALFLKPIKDRDAFIISVLNVKPSQRKELKQLIDMALLFLPDKLQINEDSKKQVLKKIVRLMEEKDFGAKHRFINLYHLCSVPGLSTKAQLLWREFFPERQYMVFRYRSKANEPLWRLYLKRLVRR